MRALALAALVAAVLAQGCHRDTPGSQTTGQNDRSGAAENPSAIAADSEEIPTEADFEDEAQQKINDQNLDDELDKLEKEIGK